MAEEKKNYIVVRDDGFVVHTKPMMRWKAEWLYRDAYYSVGDRGLRARYLEEYGNVVDVNDYMEWLWRLESESYHYITGVYDSFEKFERKVSLLLGDQPLRPQARQALEGLLDMVRELLQRPVEPRPLGPVPARYLELMCCDFEEMKEPRWFAYRDEQDYLYGVGVLEDSLLLWRQNNLSSGFIQMVIVRRDAGDKDVIAALANDNVAAGFLRRYGDAFRELLREHEKEMASRGYEDVVRKARLALAAADLLNAGRREEGVPA